MTMILGGNKKPPQRREDNDQLDQDEAARILPFRRREDKFYQVRIPLILDFNVRVRDCTSLKDNSG